MSVKVIEIETLIKILESMKSEQNDLDLQELISLFDTYAIDWEQESGR